MTIHCRLWISLLCTTALLPLCRSEAQLNPDEKGAILAAGSTPLGPAGIRPPGCLQRALPDFLISFPVMAPVFPCYASENSLLRVRREFSSKPLL